MPAREIISARTTGKDARGRAVGSREFEIDIPAAEVDWGADGLPLDGSQFSTNRDDLLADSYSTVQYGNVIDKNRVRVNYSSDGRFVFNPTTAILESDPPAGSDPVVSYDLVNRDVIIPVGRFRMIDVPAELGGVDAPAFFLDGDDESGREQNIVSEPRQIVDVQVFLENRLTFSGFQIILSQTNRLHVINGTRALFRGPTAPIRSDDKSITYRWEIDAGTPDPENFDGPLVDIDPGFLLVQRPAYVFPPKSPNDPASQTPFYRLPYHSLVYTPSRGEVSGFTQAGPLPLPGVIFNRPDYIENANPQSYLQLPGNPNL